MSDTSHHHAPAGSEPTEGDGVNYRGIVWFVAILAGTTFACQLLMWGMFAFMDRQAAKDDAAHPSLALTYGNESSAGEDVCCLRSNRTKIGCMLGIMHDEWVALGPYSALPQPNLMADEPLGNSQQFRANEDNDARRATAGSTRTTASCAFRSIARRTYCSSAAFPAANRCCRARRRRLRHRPHRPAGQTAKISEAPDAHRWTFGAMKGGICPSAHDADADSSRHADPCASAHCSAAADRVGAAGRAASCHRREKPRSERSCRS